MPTTTTFLEPGTDATEDLSFFTTFTSSTGTVVSDGSKSHTGPRSLKSASGATSGAAQAITPLGILADSGTQIDFYVQFDALPSADSPILLIRSASTGVLNLLLRTTGVLQNAPVGGTLSNGTTVLSANTWYRICVSYFITNTTTYTFKVYVNGVLDSTTNAGTLTNTTTSQVRFGWGSSGNGPNKNLWFDDIYVATGGASSGSQPDTGNILVTAKRPFSNGTTNGFTTQIGSGGSGYGTGHAPQVNERPLSTTNGWSIVGAGSAITEEYNIEGESVGDVDVTGATIVDYMGWLYTKAVLAETAKMIVNGVSTNISVPANTNTMFQVAAGSSTYPAGSGSDIGETTSTTVTTVSLYECGVIVAFTPASAALFRNPFLDGLSAAGPRQFARVE